MGRRRQWGPMKVSEWIWRRPMWVKISLGVVTLVLMRLFLEEHYFVLGSEFAHMGGLIALIFKLTRQKICSGLSLKTQELNAIFLITRMSLGLSGGRPIHAFIDSTTLLSTLWVVYMIRFKLSSSYTKELDTLPRYYLVLPSFVVAILVQPYFDEAIVARILWAFAMYLESVSVLPQLRLIQNAKMVEPFTSHYVFALGVSRFFSFAHLIFALIETRGAFLFTFGKGAAWIWMIVISKLVHTFILADFCYYYVKSTKFGDLSQRISRC